MLGTIWPPLPQGSTFVSVAQPLLQIRDTPKVRSILDKSVQLRGCCGSGWGSYSLPVKHGSDSPGISLQDLPKSWMTAFLLHPAIPPAARTNASLLLDAWQQHTLIIQALCSSQKGGEDSSASPQPCPHAQAGARIGWEPLQRSPALIQDCLQPAQQ